MKPSARIQACIDILERTAISPVPLDTVVGDYMRHRSYVGAKDRAAIAERVYGMTRAHAKLGWWLERENVPDAPRNRLIAYLCLAEGTDLKYLKDLFDGSKYSPAELDEKEISFAEKLIDEKLEHADMPISVRVECPPLYEEKLKNYFGDEFESEMRAILNSASLDLRVNTFLAERSKVKAYLEADGVATDETPYSPWGLRARGKAFLSRTKAFSKGWVEIQDEGSQLISHVCGVKSGMQVLDYCAGAGGKTLALAAAMERKGRIVAMDNDDRRLEKGRQRYRKAQLSDIIEVRSLNDEKNRKWLRRQKGTFDVVLLDVPCTGTGTWRRNPDMRWRVYGPSLEELTAMQAEIMDRVVHTVKPGGRIVYATCSLLPDESEDQVTAFLSRHPEFEVMFLENAALGNPYMRLTPLRHNTDGFFAAVLRKKEVE